MAARPPTLRPTPPGVSLDRQRRLLQALDEATDGLTRPQMARALGAPVRAVERAIQALRTAGAKIDTRPASDARQKRFVLTEAPTGDWPILERTLASQVARDALRRTGGSDWPVPTATQDTPCVRRGRCRVEVRGTALAAVPGATKLRPLLRALSDPTACCLALTYRADPTAPPRVHRVVPHALVQDAVAGGTYLVAWDLAHLAPAIYRLPRIVATQKLEPRVLSMAAREALDDAVHHQIGGWAATGLAQRAEVRVTDARWARHFIEAHPDLPEVQVIADPDHPDRIRVSFAFTALPGALRWVLQLGSAAEVLGPPVLRNTVAIELARAARRYQQPRGRSLRP